MLLQKDKKCEENILINTGSPKKYSVAKCNFFNEWCNILLQYFETWIKYSFQPVVCKVSTPIMSNVTKVTNTGKMMGQAGKICKLVL